MDKVSISFTHSELSVLNEAICMMPYFKAEPIIRSINMQLSEIKSAEREAEDQKE